MITETPWLEGPATRIWAPLFDQKKNPSAIAGWVIHAPWMHPAWAYHSVSLVHLRPLDGVEAHFQFEGATHEFQVYALDPRHEPSLDFTKHKWLTPLSIAQQFTYGSDAGALEFIEKCLERVAEGLLSVDSDFRGAWRHILTEECEIVPRPASKNV